MTQWTFDGNGRPVHPVFVYAYADTEGRIVYIGQTYDLPTRNGAHRQRSAWWSADLKLRTLSKHMRRLDARRAERAAIRKHAPLHNIHHNLGRGIPAQLSERAA